MSKAIVFFLKYHITNNAKVSNARSSKYIGSKVFENITPIIEGSSLPVFHICLLYGFKSNANSTLRKNLCKFKNCDKSDILERLKNNRSNFFTVYNGYCNLSRFFGYQPAGMERSGMESG